MPSSNFSELNKKNNQLTEIIMSVSLMLALITLFDKLGLTRIIFIWFLQYFGVNTKEIIFKNMPKRLNYAASTIHDMLTLMDYTADQIVNFHRDTDISKRFEHTFSYPQIQDAALKNAQIFYAEYIIATNKTCEEFSNSADSSDLRARIERTLNILCEKIKALPSNTPPSLIDTPYGQLWTNPTQSTINYCHMFTVLLLQLSDQLQFFFYKTLDTIISPSLITSIYTHGSLIEDFSVVVPNDPKYQNIT